MRFSILALALILAGDCGDDAAAKKDLDRLQGDWPVVSCEVGNHDIPSPDGPHRLAIEGDQLAIVRNGKQPPGRLTIKLDPSKSPARIQISGPGGLTYQGIYEFDGKRLRICYNQKTRPSGFDAKEQAAAPHNVLYELKRE
jgi:uncharacterized protein (TIGR03067 family)